MSSSSSSAPPAPQRDVKQYLTFSREQNPFTHTEWFTAATSTMTFFTPRSVFSTSAQCYHESMSGMEEVHRMNMEIISLFCYLYWNVYECLYLPRVALKKPGERKGPGRPRKRRADDGDNPPATPQQQEEEGPGDQTQLEEEAALQERIENNHLQERGPSALFALIEFVPHFTDLERMAGLNLRMAANNSEKVVLGKKLLFLFTENEKRITAEMNGKPIKKNPQLYHLITFDRYCDLVSMYTGVRVSLMDRNREAMWAHDSIVNPCYAFNLFHACKLAKKAGARSEFFDPASYLSETGMFGFPSHEHVYHLNHTVMRPNEFHRYLWPHVRKPLDLSDTQRTAFIRTFVKSAEEEALDGDGEEGVDTAVAEEERKAEEQRAGEIYDRYMRVVVSDDNAMNMKGLTRRMDKRWQAINGSDSEQRLSFDDLRKARLLVQMDGIREFESIFHASGDVPNSIKCLAMWKDRHLTKYRNFRLPQPKVSRNLSRLSDFLCTMYVKLEVVFGVAVLHMNIAKGWLACLNVYSNDSMQLNKLVVGRARLGKSMMFNIIAALLVQSIGLLVTYINVAYATSKSNITGTHEYNHRIEFHEEAEGAMLGVVHDAKKRATQATTGEPREALFKQAMTTTEVIVQRNERDAVTGKIAPVVIVTPVNNVYFLANNDSLRDMSVPIRDRCDAYEVCEKQRSDGGDISFKIYANLKSKVGDLLRSDTLYLYHRNHMLCGMIHYAILGRIFPTGIDLSCARIVFYAVLRRAKQLGLTATDNSRNILRLLIMTKSLVLQDAIDKLMDSEVSPFKGVPWKPEHLLQFEPYLVATLEHCVLALGLLSNQFESDMSRELTKTLRRTLFAKAIAMETASKARGGGLPYPHLDEECAIAELDFQEHRQYVWKIPMNEQIRANKEHEACFNSMYYSVEFPVVSLDASKHQHAQPKPNFNAKYTERDKPRYKEDLLTYMREYVTPHLHVRPKPEELDMTLMNWTTMTIPNENDEVTGTDYALYFADGRAYIAKSVLMNSDKNSLKSVTEEVVSKFVTSKRQMLWGMPNEELPYLSDTVVLDPSKHNSGAAGGGGDGAYEVCDPTYVEETLKHYCQNASICMHEELLEKQEGRERELSNYMNTRFSKTPSIRIDGDLDRYVVANHLKNICVKSVDMENMPSPFPDVYKKQVIQHIQEQRFASLACYPACFPYNAKAAIDKKNSVRTTEEDVSIAKKTARLTRELEFFDDTLPAIIEDDEVVATTDADDSEFQLHEQRALQAIAAAAALNSSSSSSSKDVMALDI